MDIKLTSYSHGAGCGCKISPAILDQILKSNFAYPDQKELLVGNHSKDDAAVYDLGNEQALISTTDFFMPIVDDPYDYGRIASANAISDIYAMGGKPILAIAILGWPINKIGADVANEVIRGSRDVCYEAGITLAGGHSIDSPEPIFGLSVNGLVHKSNLKKNSTAEEGDVLLITKSLGIGILSTAQKKGLLHDEDVELSKNSMIKLNVIGEKISSLSGVHAMTDVTGFGLLGHLTEMCEGSNVSAKIFKDNVPYISERIDFYIDNGCVPGGTYRNQDSYGHKIMHQHIDQHTYMKLADPQTSGGLLISVNPKDLKLVQGVLSEEGLQKYLEPIGVITQKNKYSIYIE